MRNIRSCFSLLACYYFISTFQFFKIRKKLSSILSFNPLQVLILVGLSVILQHALVIILPFNIVNCIKCRVWCAVVCVFRNWMLHFFKLI